MLLTNVGCQDWTGSLTMRTPLPGGQESLEVTNAILHNTIPTDAPTAASVPTSCSLTAGERVVMPYGFSFGGFLGYLSGSSSIDYTCTNSQGQVTSGSHPYFTSLDIHVTPFDTAVRIDTATGHTVSGTPAQTGDSSATGSWTFVGSSR